VKAPRTSIVGWIALPKYQPNPPKVKTHFRRYCHVPVYWRNHRRLQGGYPDHGNSASRSQQISAWFPTFSRGTEPCWAPCHIFMYSAFLFDDLTVYNGWNQILVPRPRRNPLAGGDSGNTNRPSRRWSRTMYIGMMNHPDLKKTDMSCIKGAFSGVHHYPSKSFMNSKKTHRNLHLRRFRHDGNMSRDTHQSIQREAEVGSVGLPISDTVRIVDLDDGVTDIPIGKPGELIVKGPQVMKVTKGWRWNSQRPEDGWMYTGDIAHMDEDGYSLSSTGRRTWSSLAASTSIPVISTRSIMAIPKLKECCFHRHSRCETREECELFVVLKEGQTATAQEMIEYGKAHY